MERKYRALEGRQSHLWDVKDLERSPYEVGTNIVDHFEVVEHTDDKVRFPFTLLTYSLEVVHGAYIGVWLADFSRAGCRAMR